MLPPIPKDVYELYSGLSCWERWHVKTRWRLCPFLSIARYVPDAARVVDIGCGRGLLANYLALASPSRRVVGIDRQEKRIRAAQSSVRGRANIQFRYQDVFDLEVGEIDVIVMSDFLHHLTYPQQEKVLSFCRRLLSPEGLLLIEEVGDQPSWKWLFHLLADRFLNRGVRQYYRRPGEWIALLGSLDFSVASHPVHAHIPLPDFLMICRNAARQETL